MKVRLASALALALALAAPAARADREKAAAAYKSAAADFARGAFADAAASFESAFAEDPRGASAYNAALSWQNAHDDARAADDFARALAAGDLGDALRTNAVKQLAKLEATLGRVSISGPAGARFALAHARGAPPAIVHVAPGHYVVHATFEGGASSDVPVDVAAGAEQHVDVAPPPPPTPPPPPAPPPEIVRREGLLGAPTAGVSIGLLGGAVVGAGFAIGLGVAAIDALDAYKQTGYSSQAAHDHATALRDACSVVIVSASALAAAGLALLLTIHRVHVRASVGVGSFAVAGVF